MSVIENYNYEDYVNYDSFSDGKRDFYSKFSHHSILCQGKHWEKPPFVTILIPTYKRPELLQEALESALNQKGFSDYQILIADNEGKPIEEETLTSRIVKKYQDEKVIYYRHSEEVIFRMDAVVRLARSPWIVFLHDDDILAENHLKIMTDIVKKHKEIKFLGCARRYITAEEKIKGEGSLDLYNYTIMKFVRDTTCLGNWTDWLGALISRRHYIAVGGMPMLNTGVGDVIMVAKFLHHFGIYLCNSNKPLYYYRRGEQQLTYTHRNKLEQSEINRYLFYKYAINKYHKLTHKIWERNVAYSVLETCENYYNNGNIYHTNIDIDRVILECGMPKDIKKKNVRYYVTKYTIILYRKCVWRLAYIYRQRLKKSDIYIAI